MSLGEIAVLMGLKRQTLLQFHSHSTYGTSNGDVLGKAILAFIAQNPPEPPVRVSGKLYTTRNVRLILAMVEDVKSGAWGMLYGAPGTQKTETFKHLMLDSYMQNREPDVIWVQCEQRMAPMALLEEIGIGLGAYLKNDRHRMIRSIGYAIRRRKRPVALVIDEAQKLMGAIDTIETLRDVGDKCDVGLLIAGHDDVEHLFDPRPNNQFAQWTSRVRQIRRSLEGISRDEAAEMITGELGALPAAAIERLLKGAYELDQTKKKEYLSVRLLFNSIKMAKKGLKDRDTGHEIRDTGHGSTGHGKSGVAA
jgi:type II secretory pathway predicted ATPase ExeA